MLDIAWPEFVVIGAVALVAIGPKDLPKVMHTVGQWAGKARRVVREFQHSMEQLSYEAEISEKLKKQDAENATFSEAAKPPTAETPDRERPGPA